MEKKILTIGKTEIDYSWICVKRTLEASDIYFSAFKVEEKTNSKILPVIIDAVIILIRIDFEFSLDWLRRRLITRKYILKHLGYTELSDFLEVALEPILGDKKKELKARENIDLILEKLLEKITPEELSELLQKQVVYTDGQKTISTIDSQQAS